MRRLLAHLQFPQSGRGIAAAALLVWAVSVALLWNCFGPVPRATFVMQDHVEPRLHSSVASYFSYCFRASDSGFTPDGRTFVSSHTDFEENRLLYLWDAQSGSFLGGPQGVGSVSPFFGPEQRSWDNYLKSEAEITKSWMRNRAREPFEVTSGDRMYHARFQPSPLTVTITEGKEVRLLREADADLTIQTPLLVFSPDDKTLLVSFIATPRESPFNSLLRVLHYPVPRPSGVRIIECWDVPGGSRVAVLEGRDFAAFYEQGHVLLTESWGVLELWDMPLRRPIAVIIAWAALPASVVGLLLVLLRCRCNQVLPQAPEAT
jgi:hypothetical protein